MTRQRKSASADQSKFKKKQSNADEIPKKGMSLWWKMLTVICLGVAACIGYIGYLETRVNTPFDDRKVVEKSGLDVADRYWGSYRPGVYFGLKTRDPYSLVTGLMWYNPLNLKTDGSSIRHWCEQGDNLGKYGWTHHDGRNFGIQVIEDDPYILTTSFVKRPGGNYGGEWTSRISVTLKDNQLQGKLISLLFYTAIEDKTKGYIKHFKNPNGHITGVVGETDSLGSFAVKVYNISGTVLHESFLSTSAQGLNVLKETVMSNFRVVRNRQKTQQWITLPGEQHFRDSEGKEIPTNFIITQITVNAPVTLDVVFESASYLDRPGTLFGAVYDKELKKWIEKFNQRFESTFHLTEKGFSDEQINFAKATFSNMVGGIGYFYGASRVESPYTRGPVPYWRAPLYSAVPSRSFFPRGFLWDEGFHGLLISAWDLDIELDIICHWFDLMNIEGWIPREQILGQEALSKVPEEFVTQKNSNANPPTFFLTLHFILQNFGYRLTEEPGRLGALERLFPRLQAWFDWFNTTQVGDLPGSYRWRGRDATTNRELNPKTLTSGLDDYPRASHPNVDERHIDLRCWIAFAAFTIAEIAKLLNRNSVKFSNTYDYLTDSHLMDELHWSQNTNTYNDYGLHTDAVILKRPTPPRPNTPGYHSAQNPEKVRVVLKDPELRFIDSTFGYVSLFPFLLQILKPDSPKLDKIFSDLHNKELLWTKYGLRSLATSSPLYMKYNTEHDPPYWRGQIWININFLAVRSLYFYSKQPGPYKSKAKLLYDELRQNLINNIFREYNRTGFVWEQYLDKTGEGHGSRPFTGWSALIVLIMAELY